MKTPKEYSNLVYRIRQIAKEVKPEPENPCAVHLSTAEAHLVMAAALVQRVTEYNAEREALK